MTQVSAPSPVRAMLDAELADYERQKAAQQDIIQRAQTEIVRAQQIQQEAQARLLLADGAAQACAALISKLEEADKAKQEGVSDAKVSTTS